MGNVGQAGNGLKRAGLSQVTGDVNAVEPGRGKKIVVFGNSETGVAVLVDLFEIGVVFEQLPMFKGVPRENVFARSRILGEFRKIEVPSEDHTAGEFFKSTVYKNEEFDPELGGAWLSFGLNMNIYIGEGS